MSYGPDESETAEQGADLVLRVLKGQKPADLPLEQPTRFRLVVNLKPPRRSASWCLPDCWLPPMR